MRHIKNAMSGVFAVWLAVVTMLACGTGIFARAFADEPELTEKIEIDEPYVDIYGGPFKYTGEQICPSNLLVTALVDGEDVILKKNEDYSYSCGENINIGVDSGVINLTAVESSNYTFNDFSVNFSIWEKLQDISYETTTVEKTYGDDSFTNPLTETVVYGSISYTSSDEKVATVDDYGEVEIVGTGETVITAIAEADEAEGYGEGVASYTLNVKKKSVSILSATAEDKIYDGTDKAEISDIVLDDDELAEDYDFTALGTFDDANVGENKSVDVSLRFSNDAATKYELTQNFETTAMIEAFTIDEGDVTLSQDEYIYSGNANNPLLNIKVRLDDDTDVYLDEGEDYELVYPDDTTNVGEKNIRVRGINNFEGEFEVSYAVNPYVITASDVTLEYDVTRYDGTAKTPGVTVKVGERVVDPNDYIVMYDSNVNVGVNQARVTVLAKNDKNITGYVYKYFTITAKDVLEISGISAQTVTYTGMPVELAGNLTVSDNTDGITANDLTVKWYDEDGDFEISQPTDAGSYVVVYSYNNEHYEGSLTVEFTIARAVSPLPPEMNANLTVEAGSSLDEIEGERTEGFYWQDESASVGKGYRNYAAYYTYNDDEDNYTTISLNVPVYGFARVYIDVEVDTEGGDVDYVDEAIEGEQVVLNIVPEAGYEVRTVMLNGTEVTNQVKDNKLTLTTGTTDIDVLVSFRKIYSVIEGNGLSYVIGETTSLASFRFDADHELFVNGGKVYVDGMLIGEGYYTHSAGSTIITFTDEFMNFIGNGEHTVAVVFGDGGIARAEFFVAGASSSESPIKVPDTGFFTGNMAGARVAGLVTAVIVMTGAGVVFYKKKYAGSKIDFDKKK